MASEASIYCGGTDPDAVYITRLVYDVLMYTLPMCGYPKKRINTLTKKSIVNVYERENFLMIAGAQALQISLSMRDQWKQMFISRRKSSGFKKEDLPRFITTILLCCPLNKEMYLETMMVVSLALCNELLLFFHHEGIDIKLDGVIMPVSETIFKCALKVGIFGSKQNESGGLSIEDLFVEFDNILEYTRWQTAFISKFAIPYGSREGFSDLFLDEMEKRHADIFAKLIYKRYTEDLKVFLENSTIKKLKDKLGFLPHDLFTTISAAGTVQLPEPLELALGWTLPGDRESPEPPELLTSPVKGAIEERESFNRRPTGSANASEQVTKVGQRIKKSSELGIEDNLGQMSMGAERIPHVSQFRKAKSKRYKKKK